MASRGTPVLPLLAGLAGVLGLVAAAVLLLKDAPAPVDSGADRAIVRSGDVTEAPADRALPVYVPEIREEPPAAAAPPSGGLTGRLVDAFHIPVPRGRVAAMAGRKSLFLAGGGQLESLGLDPVEVSGDGRFHFAGLPVHTDITLRVDGTDFVRTESGPFRLRPDETKDIGDIVTENGYLILGRVFNPQGKEILGARVELAYGSVNARFAGGKHATPERVVVTGDDGQFEMPHAPRWPFILTVSAKGFATRSIQGGSTVGDDLSEVDFTIVLERARALRGLIVSEEDDEPLAGITLLAVNDTQATSRSMTVSGRDGRFVFDDLAAGSHHLQADGVGWAKRTLAVSAAAKDQDKEVIIRMKKEGSISGRVTNPEDEPVTRFDLRAFFGKTKSSANSPTTHALRIRDNDGRFEVSDLEPGWYRLEVWSKGFALTTTGSIRVQANKPVPGIAITMMHGATIRGRVIDDLNRPIAGAAITLHTNNLAQIDFLRVREWKSAWQLSTHTDDDGVFQLTDVSERAYQVQVDHPDYPVYLVNDVITESGRLADMQTIVVPRPGEISGVAMDSSGQVLRRGTISLGGPISRKVQPDGEGRFSFRRLLPGDYFIDARSDKRATGFEFALEIQRGMALQPVHVGAGEKIETTVTTP